VGGLNNFVEDYIQLPYRSYINLDHAVKPSYNVIMGAYIRPKSSSIIELLLLINLTVFLR
jgi:hypothetical protein